MIAATVLLVLALAVVAILGIGEVTTQTGSVSVLPAPLATGDPVVPARPTPNLKLIGEGGEPTSLAAFHGRWLIFAPSLTLCHEVCPMTTGALMALSRMVSSAGLARKVVIAEVTVDPWRDSPARLRAYKRLTGLNFELLTGTLPEIRRFWRFFGVYFKRTPAAAPGWEAPVDWMTHRPETMDVEHSDGLFFLDPAGRERIEEQGMPDVHGHLSTTLRSLLDRRGAENLAHPELPWTATQAMDDLDWLMGREVPAAQVPSLKVPSPGMASRELTGSPRPLAALHAQAGELLGSATQLVARLKPLHGYPVVINAWASWCPPCQEEFPLFAAAAAAYGRMVAFIGVDTNDESRAARVFLDHHPVSYPSYQSSGSNVPGLASIFGVPTTIYLGPEGRVRFVHIGQYSTERSLEADIQRYAIDPGEPGPVRRRRPSRPS